MSGTNPDRQNFVRRNRIVAGMSDATIVVESADKGGALITAGVAGSYHRDCFAFPGRINDEFSAGCNQLIKSNQAALILSAKDFVETMGWSEDKEKTSSTPQINTLVVDTNIPVNRMSALLFELEMKGVLRVLAGGIYRLL